MDKDDLQNSNSGSNDTPIYLTSNSTLQTAEEHIKDQAEDPTKDSTISVSNDDLHLTEIDRLRMQSPDGSTDETDAE